MPVDDLKPDDHFQRYPMLLPYVGANFHATNKPSLLLIGESHYFPSESKHVAAKDWYVGNGSTLSPEELAHITTAEIIEGAREERFWNKGHSIWKNSFWEINEFGPKYADYRRVADDIAFYNFFQRPALTGDSLQIETIDIDFACNIFHKVVAALKPTGIVFLSQLAYRNSPRITDILVLAVPHPGCKHWNVKAKAYGNLRGRDVLGRYISSTNWPVSHGA